MCIAPDHQALPFFTRGSQERLLCFFSSFEIKGVCFQTFLSLTMEDMPEKKKTLGEIHFYRSSRSKLCRIENGYFWNPLAYMLWHTQLRCSLNLPTMLGHDGMMVY